MDPEPTAPAADAAPAPAAPAAGTEQPAAAAPAKRPGIRQQMAALLSDKTKLVTERDAAIARADEAEAATLVAEHELAQATNALTSELLAAAGATMQEGETAADALSRRVSELESTGTAAQSRVTELEGEAQSAQERADETVAAAGFPASNLPAATAKANGETRADLESQLSEATDPKERFKLAAKLSPLGDLSAN